MRTAIVILAFAFGAGTVFGAESDEIDTPFEKLPENIQTAMRQVVGKGEITKTVKETEKDGTVVYEVSYNVGETRFEAEVSPEGKLIVLDEEISLSKAPEAVQKVIQEKTAGGEIIKIEKATKGEEVFYEAEFAKGEEEHEVKVAPDGKVISTK